MTTVLAATSPTSVKGVKSKHHYKELRH